MVGEREVRKEVLEEIGGVYEWLDEQLRKNPDLTGECQICGKCCDFGEFKHRLFVTRLELMYLEGHLDGDKVKVMSGDICPYNLRGKCTIYKYRFGGCRIFHCRGDKDFQSRLSESVLAKLKSLCVQFEIGYEYSDLATALNKWSEA